MNIKFNSNILFYSRFGKKLKIRLRPYEVIVLQEIYNLLDMKYKEEEEKKNIWCLLTNSNLWKAGIIINNYESFNIYKQKIVKKLNLDKLSLKKKLLSKIFVDGLFQLMQIQSLII